MHFVKVKGILSSKNGMNLYRGCSHGCIYCDSRSDCYQMNHCFEDIEIKENAIELLEYTLRKKQKKAMIGTGSMADPYQPIELSLKMTRKSMELAYKYGFGFTFITKSTLFLRDLDLLIKLNKDTRCVVQMTLTTINDDLCKKIEPNVDVTSKRIQALHILKNHQIPTIVWMSPFLPFINDTKENLLGLLDACLKANVKGILNFGIGLTLREGNREYFYQKLDELFPGLSKKYENKFKNQYECSSEHHNELMKLFIDFCEKNKIMYKIDEIFTYLHYFPQNEQLSLF